MSDELHVHQCPYCELRFRFLTEVKDHVVHDHPDHAAAFQPIDASRWDALDRQAAAGEPVAEIIAP